MKHIIFIFLMLLTASCWGGTVLFGTEPVQVITKYSEYTARKNLDTMKYFSPHVPYDTTRFHPVIDTVRFDKIYICGKKHIYNGHVIDSGYYKWVPILDTIWKPKIQVYLTPEEYKKLKELLH